MDYWVAGRLAPGYQHTGTIVANLCVWRRLTDRLGLYYKDSMRGENHVIQIEFVAWHIVQNAKPPNTQSFQHFSNNTLSLTSKFQLFDGAHRTLQSKN